MDETAMSQWIQSAPDNGVMSLLFIGFISYLIFDLLCSLCDYLINRGYLVSELREIIAKNVATYDVDTDKEKILVSESHDYYKSHLERIERRDKFFNKFKSFFKR